MTVETEILPGRARRGRKPRFHEQDVIDAAFAMGLDRFTLAGIAEHLGVATSALYRLFPSRDLVLEACVREAFDQIRVPDPDVTWQDALRVWATEIWRILTAYPGLSTVILDYGFSGASATRMWSAYSALLLARGKTQGQVSFAYRLVSDICVGAGMRISGAPAPEVSGEPGDWRWVERHRNGMPVEDLWTTHPDILAKTEVVIAGLERHWPEAAELRTVDGSGDVEGDVEGYVAGYVEGDVEDDVEGDGPELLS